MPTAPILRESGDGRRRVLASRAFVVAAACGLVHAAFSVYWGLGGTWLLNTLGAELIRVFAPMRWAIVIVGIVKAVAAVAPWWFERSAWPLERVTRPLTWLGASVLVVWGGLGCVSANLVLAGMIGSPGSYDRDGMIGHAWLWDPLFLAWGLALVLGLWCSRTTRDGARPPR